MFLSTVEEKMREKSTNEKGDMSGGRLTFQPAR